ncbi:hypothetical protein HK105_209200 [Polyrhizophydium stewartii]|uniref:AAR2 protein n=1 Tax=Polyrhizophydium stewartii TaxID=2732419 RepID=A0ABR4MVN7_9FUNG
MSTLLLLGVPAGAVVGIDCSVWRAGPHVRGIAAVPPGVHFVHCTAGALRAGFVVSTGHDQLLVWRWDADAEVLVPDVDPSQLERYRASWPEFEPFLAPYPLDGDTDPAIAADPAAGADHAAAPRGQYAKWQRLTSHISPAVLARILPPSGAVSAMTSISHFSDIPASASRTAGSVLARSLVPGELESNADRIRFSPIDLKRSFPPGATGAQLTKFSLDKSFLLESAISGPYGGDETLLLGEFQLAFVIFLIGQVYDGFEQWKTMVQLVYLSSDALRTRTAFFSAFTVDQLRIQLEECPSDFFHDSLASGSFLHTAIKRFAENMRESDASLAPALVLASGRLTDFLFERFNWVAVPRISTLDDSDSDDADLDGDGIPRADYRIRSTFACRNEGGVVDDIEDEEDDEYRPVIVYDVE